MKVRKNGTWVLWYECIGFGLILLLTWLNELTGLPDILLIGQPHIPNLRYTFVQTVVILMIWAMVFILTKRLVAHLHHLEGFLRVCAWCRKVGYKGKWVKLEQYFADGFNIATTHGMCPDCLKKIEEDTKRFYRSDLEKRQADGSQPGEPQPVQAATPDEAVAPLEATPETAAEQPSSVRKAA